EAAELGVGRAPDREACGPAGDAALEQRVADGAEPLRRLRMVTRGLVAHEQLVEYEGGLHGGDQPVYPSLRVIPIDRDLAGHRSGARGNRGISITHGGTR